MDILKRTGFKPSHIEFEITEGILIEAFDQVIHVLERLIQLGFRFSLDDFGTGYSSLSYLKKLPISILKIDKSFVWDLAADQENSLVGSIIDMAHKMKLYVIAEGVENDEQYKLIHHLGCDAIQGYYIGRPQTQSGMVHYLKEQREVIGSQ